VELPADLTELLIEARDGVVRARMRRDEAEMKKELIELLGEEWYNKFVGVVLVDLTEEIAETTKHTHPHSEQCPVEYTRTDEFRATVTTLRQMLDFIRHMAAEGFALDDELLEPVTIYTQHHYRP
jgi:hypothetical protein